MRGSATRCSTNLISQFLSMLSKDTTTHYPPQGPPRAGEDHSPAAPVQRESIGGFWATALSGQATSDSDFARWKSLSPAHRVDRPRFLHTRFSSRTETEHLSRFCYRVASYPRCSRRSPQSPRHIRCQRRKICSRGERPSCNAI